MIGGGIEMETKLIAVTPDPERVCALAMRSCHTPEPAHRIEDMTDDIVVRMIVSARKIKHFSVLEHANFTFSIGGVSRALTHQLVRHRVASYSQQSQRYVKMDKPTYVMPPSVIEMDNKEGPAWVNTSAPDIFDLMMEDAWENYNILIDMGMKPEDARFVLPNACTTNIVVTMNARELLHFFHLRCSKHAQWEIRRMANEMLEQCREVAPNIFAGDPDEWE